jgi:glycosyltransferase involved in cell wall biosynthesis
MRVALTVDPIIPVPPRLYGGIERVVDLLVRGLAARGHAVTLLAHPESRTAGTLVPYGVPPHRGPRARGLELWQVGAFLARRHREFDVVHSFGRLAALAPVLPMRGLAKVQSYQRDVVPWRSVRIATRLAGRTVRFTGCSTSVYRERARYGAGAGLWHTVFNGVDLARYTAVPVVAPDAPLVFLGRLEAYKGAHDAIAIARASGRRLVIAGPRKEDHEGPAYFATRIAPHLGGAAVRYVGAIDDAAKSALLGTAAALLMPVDWDEPFGIVMAEAMACGTPVIGYRRGSVPEVVTDGVTGYLCSDVATAAEAVGRLAAIDRAGVRGECERRFGDAAIVAAYEALYASVVASARA